MTDRKTLYNAVSKAAWAYFFLYFDFNLGPVSLLPDFVGMLMLLSSIDLLKEERRNLLLIRPFGVLLALWAGVDWGLSWLGLSLDGRLELVGLLVSVARLYFHFQLFTDFAALARQYQGPLDEIDTRLLRWRTIQTLLITAQSLMFLPALRRLEWWSYVVVGMAVCATIAGICLMMALFALRTVFREEEAAP